MHVCYKGAVLLSDPGVVERVVIPRAGEFSCPVQCGVLFMSDCNISQWATRPNQRNPEILRAFQVSTSRHIVLNLPLSPVHPQ